jgi:CTLH/CRA C-terminal to LisH motif domain
MLFSMCFVRKFPQFYTYLYVTEGFKEAADKFRVESGIEPCADLSSLDNRIKVRDAILGGRIKEAIAIVNELHPELLDNNRLLCFHLQVQRFSFFTFPKFLDWWFL